MRFYNQKHRFYCGVEVLCAGDVLLLERACAKRGSICKVRESLGSNRRRSRLFSSIRLRNSDELGTKDSIGCLASIKMDKSMNTVLQE